MAVDIDRRLKDLSMALQVMGYEGVRTFFGRQSPDYPQVAAIWGDKGGKSYELSIVVPDDDVGKKLAWKYFYEAVAKFRTPA
jgi:hypothetical protein